MSKKYLFGMFAAASLLFATSCSDELDSGNAGNMATVSFKIGVENGAQSRAISDGTTADKLVYAVYNAKDLENPLRIFNDGTSTQMVEGVNDLTQGNHTVTISLAKGQDYKVVFWAQNSEAKNEKGQDVYNTDDLTKVTVNYDGINNDESRDAFFKTVDIALTGNSNSIINETIVLKRPFAQLNVGVYKDDWNKAEYSGVTIEKSDVTISNVANAINLIDGTVSGSENITYTQNLIPTEELVLTTDNDKDKEDGDNDDVVKEYFKWLSMSYLLVDDETSGANRALINEVSFNFYPVSGNPIHFSEGLTDIPVQRNWRTNIVGKLLTSDVNFTIIVDPVYDGEININGTITEETNQETLKEVLERGGVVRVSGAPKATDGNISLNGLTLADDLILIIDTKDGAKVVNALTLGGNNANDADAEAPTVTVEFETYPEIIAFAGNTRNLVLNGKSTDTFNSNLNLNNAKNVTINGINFNYAATGNNQYNIQVGANVDGLVVENHTVTNLGQRFVNIVSGAKNVTIKNNKITSQEGTANVINYPQRPIEAQGVTNLSVIGNTFTNTMTHQAMWVSGSDVILIEDNKIENANTSGIQVDGSDNVIIRKNTIDAKTNGILFHTVKGGANIEVSNNIISAACGQSTIGGETYDSYGINLHSGSTATLIIKNNMVGGTQNDGIPTGKHFYMAEGITALTGSDCATPFILVDGLGMMSDGSYAIYKPEGLVYANEHFFATSGNSYKLTADIDMKDVKDWASNITANTNFTFDGNGYKISNWNTTSRALLAPYINYSFTVKNLTLENCSVNSSVDGFDGSTGLIAGTTDANDFVTIENCKVIGNTTVNTTGNDVYVGALVGYSSATQLNILNCSVEDATIGGTAPNSVGGFVGHTTAANTTIENAIVIGCTIKGERIDKSGIVVGTIQRETSMTVSDVSNNIVFDVANSDAVYGRIVGGCLFMNDAATVNGNDYLGIAINKGVYNVNLTALGAGNVYAIPSKAQNKTLTFVGIGNRESVIIDSAGDGAGNLYGSIVTFENLTVQSVLESHKGFTHIAEATYKNCNLTNTHTLYGGPSKFEGCTFTVTGDNYNVWTYGTSPSFKDCTFNCEGKSILVYNEGAMTCDLVFDTCKFIATKKVEGKTAIQMHTETGINGTLTIANSTATGFESSINNGLWNELNNGTKVPTDFFDITVDGKQVH